MQNSGIYTIIKTTIKMVGLDSAVLNPPHTIYTITLRHFLQYILPIKNAQKIGRFCPRTTAGNNRHHPGGNN